jgi:hypothetical protein
VSRPRGRQVENQQTNEKAAWRGGSPTFRSKGAE